jgi:hypothetical protein
VSLQRKKFGRLTVRKQITEDIFECVCSCGTVLPTVWRSLLTCHVLIRCEECTQEECKRPRIAIHQRTYRRKNGTKARYKSRERNSWESMRARCRCKTHHAYRNYGGKGIRVCKRWNLRGGQGLLNFLKDLGPRPRGLTLDRINPQGHYEPTNCRWAPWKVQVENQGRILWKHCEPPSVEEIRAMEARIAGYDAEMNSF